MNKKLSPQPVFENRESSSVKPSRIAYWERRDRQKKHERRVPPGEELEEHRDHKPASQAEETQPPFIERRQFVDSYAELSPEARELALAIDAYKIHFHRRFISHEELLTVIRSLGYRQEYGP